MVTLWLDDERDPNDPIIQREYGSTGDEVWVKTVEEVIPYLTGGLESISFDHDLGEGQTGYDLARLIEVAAFHNKLTRFNWRVHSANPVGKRNIRVAMMAADRYWSANEGTRTSREDR